MTTESPETLTATKWPWWRKIAFRFFAIYFLIQLAPWTWLEGIPGVALLTGYYYRLTDRIVQAGNRYLFHVREVLVPIAGSGDTSYGWAQLWTYLFIAALGCLVWSLADRRRPHYRIADYWIRNMVRYFIAMNAFFYGIIKIFALQMPFPNLSTDTLRWRDVVFDKGGLGSIGTTDTLFLQRYRRGYFTYRPDSTAQTITLTRGGPDTTALLTLRYEMPDAATMRLWTVLRGDSLYMELARSRRQFQLAERQFHWLSEDNR